MYKLLAIVGIVAVASAADVIVGKDGGRIIYDQNVTASPAIWKQTRNVTVNASEDDVIRQVVVIDNRPEKDGEARVVEGGEGEKNVTIELKSPAVFRGFDFTVQVFVENVPILRDSKNPVNNNKNDGDIILGASSSSSSTTEAAKTNNQDKINFPGLVGQDQTRQNRDTLNEKIGEQEPIATDAPQKTKTNETQDKHDEDVPKIPEPISTDSSTIKNVDPVVNVPVDVKPIPEDGEDQVDLPKPVTHEQKKRYAVKEPPKEDCEPTSTTTELTTSESTTTESTTTESTTTESTTSTTTTTTTEKPKHDYHQGHYGHHHAVPLPYYQ